MPPPLMPPTPPKPVTPDRPPIPPPSAPAHEYRHFQALGRIGGPEARDQILQSDLGDLPAIGLHFPVFQEIPCLGRKISDAAKPLRTGHQLDRIGVNGLGDIRGGDIVTHGEHPQPRNQNYLWRKLIFVRVFLDGLVGIADQHAPSHAEMDDPLRCDR